MSRAAFSLYKLVYLVCVVTDVVHLVSAQQAAVTNDRCNTANVVSTDPFNDAGNTTRATADFTEPMCDVVQATDVGVWYSYTSENGTIVEAVVASTDFAARLTVFSGTCGNPICVPKGTGSANAPLTWVASAGIEYHILVSGDTASTGRFTFSLDEIERPRNDRCEDATKISFPFSVPGSTTGSLPDFPEFFFGVEPSFRGVWYKYQPTENRIATITTEASFFHRIVVFSSTDGSCDAATGLESVPQGFRNTNLQLTFQGTQSLTYFFLVTSADSDSDVGTFSISVREEDVPLNDMCMNATAIDFASPTYSGSTVGAMSERFGAKTCNVDTDVRGVWFKYTPLVNMNITLTTFNSFSGHQIVVFFGESCVVPNCLDWAPKGFLNSAVPITVLAVQGVQHFFLITGISTFNDVGSFTFTVTRDVNLPSRPPVAGPTKAPKSPARTKEPTLLPAKSPTSPPSVPSRPVNPTRPTLPDPKQLPTTRPFPKATPRPVRSPPTKSPVRPAPKTKRPSSRPTISPRRATSRPMMAPVTPPKKSPTVASKTDSPSLAPTTGIMMVAPDPKTKRPSLRLVESPTISPRKATLRPIKAPVTPPEIPPTDSPSLSPSLGIMTPRTCPNGSPGPVFPDDCEIDCPLRGPPPVLGCVKFCDVRPIFGCAPVCPSSVTAIIPGGCRERCCSDNTTDQPTSAPMDNIIEATRQPATSSNRPMRFPSGDDFGNGLDGVMNMYYNLDYTGWDERRRQWQMFRGGP